jgi:hypothetical protein
VVGLLDSLFGRKKLKDVAPDRLFSIATAQVSLEVELGLRPAGAAALVFKPLSAESFQRAQGELSQLIAHVAEESGSQVEESGDEYGYRWLVLRDEQFEDLVSAVHLAADELRAAGFGGQLLAALFRFEGGGHAVYLVYGYKRGTFWPFVPTGGERRDNAKELELKAKLERELPIEEDLSRWFGLFGAPI